MYFKRALLCLVTMSLIGCSAHEPTNMEIQANRDVTVAQSECYRMRTAEVQRFVAQLSQVPPEQRMVVVMLHNQGEMTKEIVAAATGHHIDPCKSTNIFDAQIAEVKAKNKALSDTTGKLTNLGAWVVGGLTISSVMDKAGSDIVNSYNSGSEVNQNSKNSGSFNEVGGDAAIDSTQSGTTDIDNSIDNSTDNSENCADGNCDDGGAGITGEFNLEECMNNPPSGWSGTTPLWTPTCSCGSHATGSC